MEHLLFVVFILVVAGCSEAPTEALPDGDSGSDDAGCPSTRPELGASCTGELTCDYEENAACQDGQSIDYTYVCEQRIWTVKRSGECDIDPCPQVRPELGAPCTGPLYCDYDETMSCADDGTIRHIRACVDDLWVGAWDGDCLATCAGPKQAGEPCHGYVECYESHADCEGEGMISYWLVCSGGTWIQETRVECDTAEGA